MLYIVFNMFIRTVVEYGSCTKHLSIEVYLIDLQLYLHPNTNNIKRHSFSRADAVSEYYYDQ